MTPAPPPPQSRTTTPVGPSSVLPEGSALGAWQQFAQGLPQELPDDAYEAMANRFFNDRIAPDVVAKGHALEPVRQDFISKTKREQTGRAELVAKKALGAFDAPLEGMHRAFGDVVPKDVNFDEQAKEAEMEARRQGISVTPYDMLGEGIGMAPYFLAPLKGVGAIGDIIGAQKGLQAVINSTAAGLVQGTYDAAKAPTGGRGLAGVKGTLAGAATVGGFELLGNLSPIMKLIKGTATDAEEEEAAEQVAADPAIEQKITNQVKVQEMAAKHAGVPLAAQVGRTDGTASAVVKTADGQTYGVSDPVAQAANIAQHLQQGASIEQIGGDPAIVQQALHAVEKEQAKAGAFDTDAGPSDVTGPEAVKPQVPYDKIREFVHSKPFVSPSMIQRQFKLGYGKTMDALNQMREAGELSMGDNGKFYSLGKNEETSPEAEPNTTAMLARSVRSTDLRKGEPDWDWVDHDSSNIVRSAYDEDTRRLRIEFKNGYQYDYSNVPPGLRQDMLNADSIGKFHAQRIRPLDKTFDARQVSAPTGIPETSEEDDGGLAQRLQDSIDQYKAMKDVPKVRGSAPKGLDQEGIQEMRDVGRQAAIKGPLDEIHNATTPRHIQSADQLEEFSPLALRSDPNPNMDPRGWGDLEGLNQDDVRGALNYYMKDAPYMRPPGVSRYSGKPGESTVDVANRLLPDLSSLAERAKAEGKKIGSVVSSSDIAMVAARAKAIRDGNPFGLDLDEMVNMHEHPGSAFSWDGAGDFQEVNMNSDEPFEDKLHLFRHGHTDWNDVEAPETDDLTEMVNQSQQYGAKYKETPLVHRHVGDIPFLQEAGAEGASITPRPGEKPSVFYPTEVTKPTIFEENFHAGIGYMGLRDDLDKILWSEDHSLMTDELWHNYTKEYYPDLEDRIQGEETYIKAAKAVRTGDAAMLKEMAEADTDMEHLLDWTSSTSNKLLDRVAEEPDSLHKRAMERRIGSVVTRATRSLDEMQLPYDGSVAGIDYVDGRWAVHQPGELRYFDTREDALEHLENNFTQPLNAPELVDYSTMPDGVPMFARGSKPPNTNQVPIISEQPPPEKGGLSLIGRYFRPFYDWVADQSEKLGRPDLYEAFSKLDSGVVKMNNFMRPYTEEIEDTIGKVPQKDQSRFFKWVEALPQDRDQVTKDLAFTPEEIGILDDFHKRVADPLSNELRVPLDTFIRQVMARWRGGVDVQFPHFSDVGQQKVFGDYNDAVKVGEISRYDQNLLRVAINYMRVGARSKFLGEDINAAAKLVDEKNPDNSYKLGLVRTSLARHIEYMRGVPDHTAAVLNSVAANVIEKMNKGIELVNGKLPERIQIPNIDAPPQEAWNKLVLYMYAGELALRPALLIRDGMQFMLTTLPVLGGKYAWKGLSQAVEMGKGAWAEPERYGALIEKKDLQNLYSAGGEEKTGGKIEKFAEKAMSWIQFSHNSNRMVGFWGHVAKAEDALERFQAGTIDKKGLADESGMWFMKKPMRDKYLKEAARLDGRLPSYDADMADLSRRVAKDMVELTQWNFKRGANPGIYEHQLGRLFGQYGTWPLNYIEYARRFFTSGSSPEAIKAGVRLALVHGAVQAAGTGAGIDLSNWLWTNPMAYGGGPALELLTNIPQSMDFETQRGAEARKEIRQAFFPGLIPGGEAASTIWDAATTNDPDFWVKLMGFTPLNRSELRK